MKKALLLHDKLRLLIPQNKGNIRKFHVLSFTLCRCTNKDFKFVLLRYLSGGPEATLGIATYFY